MDDMAAKIPAFLALRRREVDSVTSVAPYLFFQQPRSHSMDKQQGFIRIFDTVRSFGAWIDFRRSRTDQSHSFVGECFLDDMMNGEAWNSKEPGQAKIFHIFSLAQSKKVSRSGLLSNL